MRPASNGNTSINSDPSLKGIHWLPPPPPPNSLSSLLYLVCIVPSNHLSLVGCLCMTTTVLCHIIHSARFSSDHLSLPCLTHSLTHPQMMVCCSTVGLDPGAPVLQALPQPLIPPTTLPAPATLSSPMWDRFTGSTSPLGHITVPACSRETPGEGSSHSTSAGSPGNLPG